MEEQLALFDNLEDSYSIENLWDKCYTATKKKYPKAMECEDYSSYVEFVNDETDLLYAEQLKDIANRIENRIYGKQRQEIDLIYDEYLTIPNKLDNIR